MTNVPYFESTDTKSLLSKIEYLGDEYDIMTVTIKSKVNNKTYDIVVGSLELWDAMNDEEGKLAGKEAVEINGNLSGYIDLGDLDPIKIKASIEKLVGDWAEIVTRLDEGFFDRLSANLSAKKKEIKTKVGNSIDKFKNRTKAVGQAVVGAATGDLSKAQQTLASAPKTKDAKELGKRQKAVSILNSVYRDLEKLFPGKDIQQELVQLYNKLIS